MIDFKIKGTKLPKIPIGTEYRCEHWKPKETDHFSEPYSNMASFGTKIDGGELYILCDNPDYAFETNYMIKLSIIENLAKEQNMVKEIIGYKAPYDLWDSYVKKGTIFTKYKDIPNNYSVDEKICFRIASEIVETWEAVYEEEFKVGDYVTLIGERTYWLKDTDISTFKITRDKSEYCDGIYFTIASLNSNCGGAMCGKFRKATQEEIESAQLTFGGNRVVLEKVNSGVRISYNNETGTLSQLEEIYYWITDKPKELKFGNVKLDKVIYEDGSVWKSTLPNNVTEIKIGSTTGSFEELEKIIQQAKNL